MAIKMYNDEDTLHVLQWQDILVLATEQKNTLILMIWKHATPCREFKLFTMNEKQDNKLSGIFIKNNLS